MGFFLLEIMIKYNIIKTMWCFYFFTKNKMPVFADALPLPSDLPIEVYSPTSIYASELGYSILATLWIFSLIIFLAFFAFWIICLRRIFRKAWLNWRGSLIPFYREYLRFKMVWRNGRWTASLFCLPMFAIVLVISYFKAAEKFGKDKEQFGMWLRFLNPIFLWILAFDESKYQK